MIEERYGDYRLSSLDPIVITIPDLSVSDEEVTREMERIASRYAANKTVEPHKVGPHDLVQIKISTKEDNRNFPGLSNENVDVRLGVGSLPPEIEEAIVGA